MSVSTVWIDFTMSLNLLLLSSAQTGHLPVTGEWITSKLPYCRRGLQLQEANAQHLVPTVCVNSCIGVCACVRARACMRV